MARMFSEIMCLIVSLLLMLGLSGCGGYFGDGRMKEWKEVRKAEEKTKQDYFATKKTELVKSKSPEKQNPTLKLTSHDKNGKVTSKG